MKYKKRIIVISFFIILFFIWFNYRYLKNEQTPSFPEWQNSKNIIWGLPKKETYLRTLKYEGFTVGYDSNRKIADWVSYKLRKKYIFSKRKTKRRNFKIDPQIKNKNSAQISYYKKSGYDRGHLARLADMKGRSALCENQSCYFTNIAPQKPFFNRRTWLNLENAVQKWAIKYGELTIVTGPIFDNDKTYLKNKKNTLEIPDKFYKIVIRKKSKGYFVENAFILDQDDRGMNLENYIVSIDSIEKVTKIDFFSLLPDEIENEFESKCSLPWKGWR